MKACSSLFVSRAGADADFAAVIAAILEADGYTVVLQQWDFANRHFVERMHAALAGGSRVVALLSPEYLGSAHCQAEWQNVIADDPRNTKSRLILLRVAECEPGGLLSGLAYWDLVPVRDDRTLLEQIVRDAVRKDRPNTMPSGPYWRDPRTILDSQAIRPVPGFSGREEELAAIAGALADGDAVAAVHGLGGVGKTSIAREYAWRNREGYSVVWWLSAQTEEGIIEGLLQLGTVFVHELDRTADLRSAAQRVGNSMLSGFAKPVLLIFDNLEDERLVRTWLPRGSGRALITSRNAAWSSEVAAIPLQTWDVQTAIGYLQREGGRAALKATEARAIVEALGALPLALSHAAASLRSMRTIAPERYLERIAKYLKSAPPTAEYPQSVFATFSAAIAQAEREAPGAAEILTFAACFAPDSIPDELLRQRVDDEPALDEALGTLDRLSLLAFSDGSRTYTMHRLVQAVARDTMGAGRLAWQERAVAAAEAAFPEVEFANWPQCERFLPHARAALDGLPRDADKHLAGSLANRCALYLWQRGEYDAAEPLARRALAIREKLDNASADVAQSLQNLAIVHYHQGRVAETISLLTRALVISEQTYGCDHPNVAHALNNLANVYTTQASLAEAEVLHLRALAIKERALGPDDPAVAMTLSNLAEVYWDQGRHAEAEPICARSLAIRQRALEPGHPDIAFSLNNLANVYRVQGRFAEAEDLCTRALAIFEKALGPDHPGVAQCRNDLSRLFADRGRHEDARRLLRQAYEARVKGLGPDHPLTIGTREELAALPAIES